MYIFGKHQQTYVALASQTNVVCKNPRTLKILPFNWKLTKAPQNTRKLWVNPKKCELRKRRSSKVNVIISLSHSQHFTFYNNQQIHPHARSQSPRSLAQNF